MITHLSNFLGNSGDEYYEKLLKEIPWTEVKWRTGKSLPRLVHRGESKTLLELCNLIEINFNVKIAGIWSNLYRNGEDYTPYHQDSYAQKKTFIISLGAARDLCFKSIETKNVEKYLTKSGDLIVFDKECNMKYKHSLPKRKMIKTPRISIVFFST
jgi:hypothetical protein